MIFAATVRHAREIHGLLSARGQQAALVTGETPGHRVRRLISAFRRAGSVSGQRSIAHHRF